MPMAQSATTTTITSRISNMAIKPLPIHAEMETGVIIASAEHTDGDPAMKDDANRPQKRTRLAWTLSLMLLPLAAGSGAQDSLRWRGASAYAPPPSQQPVSRPSIYATPQPGDAFNAAEF